MDLYFCQDYAQGYLDVAESHHCIHVKRHKIGDIIEVFDGTGGSWEAQIKKIENKKVFLTLLREHPPLFVAKGPRLILIQSILKNKAMQFLLQKVTEVGVDQIIPIVSERTQFSKEEKKQAKERKWKEILLAAVKQSHQKKFPELSEMATFTDILKREFPFSLKLMAYLGPEAKPLKEILNSHAQKKLSSVIILVGPEGDFTEKEKAAALSHGFVPINLGNQILRSETAALFLLSILNYELRF
ncbi:hypothetical protein A946_05380 [Methylacidiphilum kamchatkense Kam1]|uniref:Ribosomal RNA small subunit methyltransferase E n=1 Tax=Methylacidiphilum kamchatkense Kam1 TaxID=1202785 RepID=A0A0C1V561_9BACT|nr:RsmE family RNA methyltransferase [Methylacidiphilum kamchatkense]KIE58840.1 hypothetical protein A946_05380 [Methylacidiphilum kamchatkense Kam1]QDQ41740.1 16S rRNA (uracil1498-N3)-methyltransferase [Methylacidiphilum kamchatkense Kam1]